MVYSLPILDKRELQIRAEGNYQMPQPVISKPPQMSVNRKDFTGKAKKSEINRSEYRPCDLDYNMCSSGGTQHIRHQILPNGAIASFMATTEPKASQQQQSQNMKDAMIHPESLDDHLVIRPKTAFQCSREESVALSRMGSALGNQRSQPASQRSSACGANRRSLPNYAIGSGKDYNVGFMDSGNNQVLENILFNRLMERFASEKSAFRTNEERSEIHDLVRETVKEYFGTLSSREMAPVTDRPSSAMAGRMDQSQARRDREAWVVVKRPPEWANSRPASSRRSATPNATWNNPQNMEFKENLDSYMSSASDHEQEIVRNLLKKLNNGKTPKELLHKSLDGTVVGGSATARPAAARDQRIIPAQYQCDVSHFQPLPLVPNRHFIISPEWTSERYMVKKVPAAHLHPTATLKNKLGLLNS